MKEKKGAIDLSVSTIVIIVLAMSMLILGLFLVNKLMCDSINGVDTITNSLEDELRSLFGTNNKIILYKQENTVYKGLTGYGVAFGIINNGETNPEFSYELKVSDIGNCKFTESQAEDFVILGKSGTVQIQSGSDYFDLIKFEIPSSVQPCQLKYQLVVRNDGSIYDSQPINIIISEKPFTRSFCGS